MKKEKLVFEQKDRGFKVRAWYLEENKGDALIQLFYGRKKVREMLYPAYKIWNIAAHFSEIVNGELSATDKERGYRIAGATGFGGVIMPRPYNHDS